MREQHWIFLLICSLFGFCIIADLIVKGAQKRTPPGG